MDSVAIITATSHIMLKKCLVIEISTNVVISQQIKCWYFQRRLC